LNVLAILAFVGMPLSAAMTLIADDLILLLLGPQWSNAGQIFRAFGPSIGVAIIYITHGWLHLSLGTPDRWFRWSIVEFTVTIICFAIGLIFGTIGVAVAFSASFYILIGPAISYAGKPIQLKAYHVLARLWRYYVAALCAGILCWLVIDTYAMTAHIYQEMGILARMITATGLCIALNLILLVALHQSAKPITQFASVIREMIPKRTP
jgi:PST family polysaccharide transporter